MDKETKIGIEKLILQCSQIENPPIGKYAILKQQQLLSSHSTLISDGEVVWFSISIKTLLFKIESIKFILILENLIVIVQDEMNNN